MAKPEISAQGSVLVAKPSRIRHLLSLRGRSRRAVVLRERDQCRAPVRNRIPGLLQRCFSRVPGAWEPVGGEPACCAVPRPAFTSARRWTRAPVQVFACASRHAENPAPFADFDQIASARKGDCDDFYSGLQTGMDHEDARLVQRQAFAGMIWNKQYYEYDVRRWLAGDPDSPPPPAERQSGRNADWQHVNSGTIFSMPDKWEYPWFASWDLAFHAITFSLIDPEFAKKQLLELLHVWFLHPNGQLPAYEWNFSDANPPVHGWAAWRVFEIDRKQRRKQNPDDPGDLSFLERIFQKLLLNFTWWVNQKDCMDAICFKAASSAWTTSAFSIATRPCPTARYLSQSDGTSWMAMYTLTLMRIALELAQHNTAYDDMATKFFEHFLYIAEAMTDMGGRGVGLWNEEDGFYYDVLNLPDGQTVPMRIRSMVGLIPLFAVETLDPELLEKVPGFNRRMEWFLTYRPDLARLVSRWFVPGKGERKLLSLLRGHRMKALLRRMLDPNEFLSDYGVRSVSRYHLEHPYTFWARRPCAERGL